MVFNQKPQKQKMFTANSSINTKGHRQPTKESICNNLPLHTHDEDHFYHPQTLKLATGTYTEWILNRDKKTLRNLPESNKKVLQRQNINPQINSRFTPDLKIGTYVLIPNFTTQKGFSKKLQPLRKGPYQIFDKHTDVTYKLTDLNKKEIVQHRNNLLPYYTKEYALRELTQLYSFIGLKVIQNSSEQNQNQNTDTQIIQKQLNKKEKEPSEQISKNLDNKKKPKKERKNRKLEEKIIPQDQKDNHHDSEISHKKITKHSSHNLKY